MIKPDQDESLLKAFEKWQLWAEDQACCDFAFKVKISSVLTNQMIDEMRELTNDNFAVNCFHANMADLDDEQILEFLERCSNLGKYPKNWLQNCKRLKILVSVINCHRKKT